MKNIDIKKMSENDLRKFVRDSEEKIREINFETGTSVSKTASEKRGLKKNIARALTQISFMKKQKIKK